MYKLIALDMDGTLLDSHHNITPPIKKAIQQARGKGVTVALCTGRPLSGVRDYLKELKMDEKGDFVITYNGALVVDLHNEKTVSHLTLTGSEIRQLLQLASDLGSRSHFFDLKHVYTTNRDISDYTILDTFIIKSHLFVTSPEEVDPQGTFTKFMMVDHPEILDEALSKLPQAFKERYTVIRSAPYFLEFMNKAANKGSGVKLLAESLGIKQEEVICVGDQENDRHMIEYAGLGVAMGNAVPAIKDIACHITGTNNEHGVAQVIEKFILGNDCG